LRIEQADAEEGLTHYLKDRQQATGSRYLGIATDGADFIAYELRNERLSKLDHLVPSSEQTDDAVAGHESSTVDVVAEWRLVRLLG
jgi:hypothetical protein